MRKNYDLATAHQMISDSTDTGKASKYIEHFEAIPNLKGRKVVLWCRVSTCDQDRDGNAEDQERNLRPVVAAFGFQVAEVVRHEGSGWEGAGDTKLCYAIRRAEEEDAILLAETTDRFRRHHAYHPQMNPTAQATNNELWSLKACALGVTIATHLHPDATPGEVRSYQTRRGQASKGNKGGRPKKLTPEDKEERRKRAFQLRKTEKLSYRAIGARLGVSHSIVRYWIVRGLGK